MQLTDKEIQHIASLARIKLSPAEEEKFKQDLGSILDYINKLNEVNTDNIEPLFQSTGLVNSARKDENSKDFVMDEALNKRVIDQAPHKENRFIKVRSVISRK